MKSHLFRVGQHTLIYGLGGVALQVVGVFTLPIFARIFSPPQYGVVEIANVGYALLLLLIDFGFASASQRHFFDYTEEQPGERRIVLSTATFTSTAIALSIALVLVVLRHPISDAFFDGHNYADVVALVAVTLPVGNLANFFREVMRLHDQPWHYAIASMLSAVVTGGVAVSLVAGADVGVKGIFIAVLTGQLVMAVYGLVVSGRNIGFGFSRPELRGMLSYGIPLVPTAISLWALSFLDRVMLSKLGNLSDVGQYAVGGRFATVVMLLIAAFGLASGPIILSIYSADAELEKQVRGRLLTYWALVLTTISLILSLFSWELVSVIAPDFDRAYEVVGILCFGLVLYGLSSLVAAGLSFTRQTKFLAYYTVAAVVLNFALNLVLIPALSMFGAAAATAIAYLLMLALYWRKSQQLYPTPYEPRKVAAIVGLAVPLAALGLVHPGSELLDMGLKLGALAVFGAGLGVLGVLGREEVDGFKSMLDRSGGLQEAQA